MSDTVLLVDDEPDVIDFLSRFLTMAGLVSRTATSVAAAQAILAADKNIALLLTDIVMPETDGMALIRWTRAHRPDVECLAMTGGVHTRLTDELAELRVPHVIEKPFRFISQVVTLIVATLARHRKKRLVLLADDDRDFLRFAQAVIRRDDDLRVATVRHSESLAEVLKRCEPALILFDSMDSPAEAEAICRRYAPRVTFVSVSDRPEPEQASRLEAGARATVRKPVDSQRLRRIVRDELAKT